MKKTLILFYTLLQFWILNAEGYYCKQISIDNQLSQSAVTGVAYDGKGALWIGTRFGLNEYRNGKMRTFRDDGSGRILGNYIHLVHCDTRGNLWVSTDKGLFRYDASGDTFTLLSEDQVTCAAEAEDGLWLGSHFGIKWFSHRSGELTGGNPDVYTDFQALYLYDGKLLSLDKKLGIVLGEEQLPLPELEGSLIMASALHGDRLFLSLLNMGLVEYSLTEKRSVRILPGGRGEMPDEPLLALLVKEEVLWMGFDGASIRTLDLESGHIGTLEQNPPQAGGRIPLSVTCLYEDPHGNVWIGSVRSGLVGLKWSPVKAFNLSSSFPSAEDVIIDVFASSDGNIYLGTDGSGICRYHRDEGITLLEGMDGMKVTSIADYDQRSLIIATYNKGFFLVDRKTGARRPFILIDEATNERECFNSNSPIIYNLEDGRLLFMAVHTFIFDPRTRKSQLMEDQTGDLGTELIPIGPGNGTFYAYSQAGLFSINLMEGTLNRIYEPDMETGSVNTAVYHGGLLWIGTNYGLFSFDPRNSAVRKVDSGLFSRISRLESNGTDNLWIAADNTLFLRRNGVVEMTGENRGVPANDILSGTCAPDGTIYLGGTAGLVEIGKDCYFSVDENKKVELRDVSSGTLQLPHDYGSLVITVNLAGADPFERVLFRYHLTGTTELTTESFEDSISLPALKPGSYSLDVSYLRSDGTWSRPQNVTALRVRNPWYASVPMILLYVLLGLGFVIFSVEYLSRKRLKALEEEIRSRDMVFAGKIDAYIDEHLTDPQLNVSKIAADMAMSRATLYHKMSTTYGKGVAEVIEEKRMTRAEQLLRTTSLSILDISEKVGYSTPRYFSTRFKQVHDGQTPLKYRQSNR